MHVLIYLIHHDETSISRVEGVVNCYFKKFRGLLRINSMKKDETVHNIGYTMRPVQDLGYSLRLVGKNWIISSGRIASGALE